MSTSILRTRMEEHGIQAGLADLILTLTDHCLRGQVPEGMTNLTSTLNHSTVTHLADMGLVNRERGKVDLEVIDSICEVMMKVSPEGLFTYWSFLPLLNADYARDWPRIIKINQEPGSGFWGWCRALGEVIYQVPYTLSISTLEVIIFMNVYAPRFKGSREQVLPMAQWRRLIIEGEKPSGWSARSFGMFRTFGPLLILLPVRALVVFPHTRALGKAVYWVFVGFGALEDRGCRLLAYLLKREIGGRLATREDLLAEV